jgi:SprT protein
VGPLLPAGAEGFVAKLLARQPVHLRLSRPRRTKLGDHRPPSRSVAMHRITINNNLNRYAFLTTLLHEIAHATTWEKHRGRHRLRPHGLEWKRGFADILRPVLHHGLLPAAIQLALARYLENPAAATCSDRGLVLALAEFDEAPVGRIRVENLEEQTLFRTANGDVFRAGRLLRSRRACVELATGREFRVHGLALVEPIDPALESPPAATRGQRRR